MGMETTWDELRVTVLQKMHLIEGDKVVEDDSTRETFFFSAPILGMIMVSGIMPRISSLSPVKFCMRVSSSDKVSAHGAAVWYDRVKLETEAFVDRDTNAAVYNGYARWSAGFNNWRGMIMGGVTGGTALT